MFRRHPVRNNQGVQVVKTTSEGRRTTSSLRKDISTRDLTESTATHDLGSSLSQLELRRNKSYETEDSPVTTQASTTAQPTTSGTSDDNDRQQKQVEYVAAAMHPPPESVSLMRSGCSCSELSEDDASVAQRGDKPPLPNDTEQEAGSVIVQVLSQPPSADTFVPPEFIYLTPDNCWPLEL